MLGLALVSTAACTSTPNRQSTGEYLDDSAITTKVKSAILGDPKLKVFQISVKTYNGTVQLSGFVDSEAMVDRAAEVAQEVSGAQAVKNDLQVKKQ
jgi:hyperosmotically inducible protein